MPTRKVRTADGKTGYQWGSKGKVYTGKGAKAKADAQGKAARASGYRGSGKKGKPRG
jgi:hypothetical protein